MASRDITIVQEQNYPITIRVDGVDLADGGSTKVVTGTLRNIITGTETSITSSATVVTSTGDPSYFTWTPEESAQALDAGLYAVQWAFTDSASVREYTRHWDKVFITEKIQ